MKKRSLVVRLSATAMSAALALIAGASPALAAQYPRPPYSHYSMYQAYADTPVQKYHWSVLNPNGEPNDEYKVNDGAYYRNVNICALDGKGGSRKVGIWRNTTGLPMPADKDNGQTSYTEAEAPATGWTYVKTWSIPICGLSSGGGGNPRADNGGLDTGSNDLGKGVFWFKITRIDNTSPTVFCIDSSYQERKKSIPDKDTRHECVMGNKHTPYMGNPDTDIFLNNKNN
jgi:hypothetical protein